VVCRAIPRKDLGLLVAQSTMERRWIGKIARAAQSIGVSRPQDIAKPGQGKVMVDEDGITVTGIGTNFDTQCKAGDQLVWAEGGMKGAVGTIDTVDSHSRIVLKKPIEGKEREKGHAYKILPMVDQSAVFKQVFDRLAQQGAIGIWPEGGSHDRTELLPFKAGISMMALGAMAATPGLNITIVPVGINYFKGHRFRSRVFVDIGEPMKPSAEMVERYKRGGNEKRLACGELMDQIRSGISAVTVEAKDFDTLQLFRLMRRLHTSNVTAASGLKTGRGLHRSPSFVAPFNSVPPLEKFELIKAFANGWERIKDEPEAIKFAKDALQYRRLLKSYGVPDYRIAKAEHEKAFGHTIFGTSYLIVRTIVAILQVSIFKFLPYAVKYKQSPPCF
jgi:glycerol-3-phosphate O-acyltransferase/dihydroxyacetone phosphate acyltransferase